MVGEHARIQRIRNAGSYPSTTLASGKASLVARLAIALRLPSDITGLKPLGGRA